MNGNSDSYSHTRAKTLAAQSRSAGENEIAAGFVALALPLLVVAACFLGGATLRWSEAIVISGFAIVLFLRPPRHSLGPALNFLILLFLLLASASFLPAGWFDHPSWRIALTKDLGVALPATLTPQPWLTLDSLFLLIAGCAWLYWLVALAATAREIRRAARIFATGIALLAALCIGLYAAHRALPFWHNERGFGPFPNRNQTGDLFGISVLVVLACIQDDFRRGRKRWLGWLLAAGVLITALVLDFSRAGILILVVGVAAWLARFALQRFSGAGFALGASGLLLLFAALLLFGGATIDRFHLRLGSEGTVTSDYRWLIFRDAWTMIRSAPWCGFGLGNFDSLFALFRDVSRGEARSIHPESDWLWLWAEMGWVAIAALLAGAVLLVRRTFPLTSGSNRRLRYAALAGAILFAFHGFVDVSAHRFGTFLAGTFLLGLAQFRPVGQPPSKSIAVVFRLLALLLAGVSIAWLVGSWANLPLPGYVGVENAKETALAADRAHRPADALPIVTRALEWAPLDWQLYFLRAVTRVELHQPPAEALVDFRRARFLEPSAYQVPFDEGRAWLASEPTLAVTAWREALRRGTQVRPGLFAEMVRLARQYNPRVYEMLASIAAEEPSLTIKYLEDSTGSLFQRALHEFLQRYPALDEMTAEQKSRLFTLWAERGSLDELTAAVATRPEWLGFAWHGLAVREAARGNYRAALQLVTRFAPTPKFPVASGASSIPDLEKEFVSHPNDVGTGYALFHAQFSSGAVDDALATARHFTALPSSPAYFQFLEARCWAAKENWQRAWQAWEEFDAHRPIAPGR